YFDAGGYLRNGGSQYRIYIGRDNIRKGDLRIVPHIFVGVALLFRSLYVMLLHDSWWDVLVAPAILLGYSLFVFLQVRADAYLGPYFLSQVRNTRSCIRSTRACRFVPSELGADTWAVSS